jgi:hypothetical protein
VSVGLGAQLIEAVAAQDEVALAECFAPAAAFRALIPPGVREGSGAGEAAALIAQWFSDSSELQLLDSDSTEVGDMTDEELADAWESCRLGRAVTHVEHVRISWVLLSRHGTWDGSSRIADGTLRNCVATDASDRFDPDLTARWTESIASAVESSAAGTADKFLEEHPEFQNSRLFGLPAWMETECRPTEDG